jgi:hypothetical protein
LRLVQLPSDEFRWQLLAILSVSVFGALLWDRIVVAIFAPSALCARLRRCVARAADAGQTAHKHLDLALLDNSGDSVARVWIRCWCFWRLVVLAISRRCSTIVD